VTGKTFSMLEKIPFQINAVVLSIRSSYWSDLWRIMWHWRLE